MSSTRRHVGAKGSHPATAEPTGIPAGMPPKKQQPPKAEETSIMNEAVYQRVAEALRVIDGHELFRNAKEDDAIGLDPGGDVVKNPRRKQKTAEPEDGEGQLFGAQAAFNSDAFARAMSNGWYYRCAGNEFWLDPYFSLVTGVPVNVRSVEHLMETTFNEPSEFVGTTCVLVESGSMDPLKLRGSLKRLSPEEIWFAKMLRLAEVIQDQETDEEVLKEWKVALLGASWQFEYYANGYARPMGGALARAINLRESMVAQGLAVMRDCVQRLMEVHSTKKALETKNGGAEVSNEKLADFYKQNVKINPRAEQVTGTFIESYSVIFSNILKHTELLAYLTKMGERFGPDSPLNSTQKLRAIITKCEKTYTYMMFCLEAILDLTVSGALEPGEITETFLKTGVGCNRGFIDVLCLKSDLRHYLPRVDLPRRIQSPEGQATIRDALATFGAYRSRLCSLDGQGIDPSF